MPEQLSLLPNGAKRGESVPRRQGRIWMAAVVVLFFGVCGWLVFRDAPWSERGERPGGLPASFQLDLGTQLTVDPKLLHYRLQNEIQLPFAEPRAIACGPKNRLYVADTKSVHILNEEGRTDRVVPLSSSAGCLAVGGADHGEPGRMYVGTTDGVEVFDAAGERITAWPLPAADALLTSISVGQQDVFVADAGNRVVWRYDLKGDQIGKIGAADPARQSPGFAIPARDFDVVVAAEDLLYVVNPGRLQIVAFTFAGDRGAAWGRADSSIEGFFGCCNPAHLALLPDGRIVTSEKGIPRVKVYSPSGALESVVAAAQQLGISPQAVGDPRAGEQHGAFDIAAGSQGQVYVLDSRANSIRVFVFDDSPPKSGARS